LPAADELPWTISYVIRKRSQIDSFNELPSEKRPPDDYIWYRPPEDIERWLDRVFDRKSTGSIDEAVFEINESEIE
jgi:hypothetical protein